MKRSTLLHLRIPFSFFLMPVFFFDCAIVDQVNSFNAILAFAILHFLVYPASNGYNSYFDKDESSIGGLKHPPKVSKQLYFTSLLLDGIGLVLALFISLEFALMVLGYGIISKMYSHPAVRLKKMPYLGWLAIGIFQGYFTLLMSVMAIGDLSLVETFVPDIQYAGLLSSLLLFGSYPMTQVYQHEEDQSRGDITISLKLGILGTFHFTALTFLLASTGYLFYFYNYFNLLEGFIFLGLLSPVLIYFGYWYWLVRQDLSQANFSHTMRLNLISSTMLNVFFVYLAL
jgi:1,4-dihydroxy-2-naphthoate octaprenyltransferase